MGPSRELDGCLAILEDALERGEASVSPHIAASVNVHAPGVDISDRMPTKLALDLVFREQERRLKGTDPASLPAAARRKNPKSVQPTTSARSLTEEEAHDLTERIKSGARLICLLILEAHDRRAWKVLRYRSWSAYMRCEFGYSRSRSYELLDQGRVVRALKAAAGSTNIQYVSGLMAVRLKPQLPDLVERISSVVSELDHEQRDDAIRDVINIAAAATKSARLRKANESDPLSRAASGPIEAAALIPVFRYLASLAPPTAATVSKSVGSADDLALLERAAAWLKSLHTYLLTRDGVGHGVLKTQFRPEARAHPHLPGGRERFSGESMVASS